jgi:alkanesulfonate monooxygenase SsuD/methylene tetrahydromethanopterin reductase-like flavin-dependent oxidoreductase (luciferase family)
MPRPGERLDRLRDAVAVLRELLGGGPSSVDGRHHRTRDAVNDPASVQQPTPPIIVGGKGDRLLSVVADLADGWNTCWVWTPEAYRERLEVLARACDVNGRDPSTVTRSLGLYTLCGEDERDLDRRFERLQQVSPPGVVDHTSLNEWREGRLVGTVEQVRQQVAGWEALGVETLIVGLGAVPFAVTALVVLLMVAEAICC